MSETPKDAAAVVVAEIPADVLKAVKDAGLTPITAEGLFVAYRPFFNKVNELLEEAKAVNVTDATQVTMIKKARELRLALRRERVNVENTRKSLKEDSLRQTKAIDGMANVFKLMVEPVEDKLLAAEEFAERVEAKRKADLAAARKAELESIEVDTQFYQLAEMDEAAYQKLLAGQRAAYEAQKEAARKAEEEKKAREAAEAAERERIRLENEKLKAERERLAKEKQEADARAKAAEAEAKRQREDADRRHKEEIAKKEREAAERVEQSLALQRKQNEEARKRELAERAAAEAAAAKKAAAEKEKREAELAEAKKRADEAEAKAKQEREARAAAEKAEADRKAKEAAAAKKAAQAPDHDKLMAFAKTIRGLTLPELRSENGVAILNTVSEQRDKLATWLEKQASTLV